MADNYPKILLYGTQSNYDAIESKSANVLYWTSDTNKIYKGSQDFSKSVEAANSKASLTTPAKNRVYLFADSGNVEFFDGTNWHVLNLPAATSFNDSTASDLAVPTTNAVKEYVASIIGGSADIVADVTAKTGEGNTGKIEVTYGDDTVQTPHKSDVTIPGVGTTLSATTAAATIKLAHTTGTDDTVVVPGVVTGVAATTGSGNAAKVTVTDSAGQSLDVTIPGVVTGVASATGTNNEAKITVTDSAGNSSNVEVPGVFTDVSWDATARVMSFTVAGAAEATTVDIGKDIFIDPAANNRYENGNIYLYLNDGEGTTPDTEIVIPVTALITDYFGDDTDSVSVSIDNTTHKVTADVVIRPNVASGAGAFTNALKLSTATGAKGLYVDLSDVEEEIADIGEAVQWGTF